MKHNSIILTVLLLALTFIGCKKPEQETIEPSMTDIKLEVAVTTAVFTWKVNWIGKFISMVELSEHEDMSDSQFYGSEEEADNVEFSLTINGLNPATKYYYRILVWNHFYANNKYIMEEKNFETCESGAGVFSVSDIKKVTFSNGNLQVIRSVVPSYWKFADNQWDYFGENQNFNSHWDDNLYLNDTIDGDLLSFKDEFFDYPIINGDGYYWRNLSIDEWNYILNSRITSSGGRYVKGKVGGVNGLIILPDYWLSSIFTLNDINGGRYSSNMVNLSVWTEIFETNGAVFLPAAGFSTCYPPIDISVKQAGKVGAYASYSKKYANSCYYYLKFDDASNPTETELGDYYDGYGHLSVRLVRDVQ